MDIVPCNLEEVSSVLNSVVKKILFTNPFGFPNIPRSTVSKILPYAKDYGLPTFLKIVLHPNFSQAVVARIRNVISGVDRVLSVLGDSFNSTLT